MDQELQAQTRQVLDRWITQLSALNLRISRDGEEIEPSGVDSADDPDDPDEPLEILIGRRDYQGVELELLPAQGWGSLEDSQSCERFEDGAARHTTAWDDGWTDVTLPEGAGYTDWVERSLRKVVACHLRWGVEGAMDLDGEEDSDLDREGNVGGVLQLSQELRQVRDSDLGDIPLTEVLTALSGLSDTLLRAADGDDAAARAVGEAASAPSAGGLDDKGSLLAVLVVASREFPPPQQETFAAAAAGRLESETRRVGEAAGANLSGFTSFKTVMDLSPPPVNAMIGRWLQEMAAAHMPADSDARALQEKINRYNELTADWRAYQPSADDPDAEGARLMALEAEINATWRAEFAEETGLVRSELQRRRVSEGRFLSGGSAAVLGWLRVQGRFQEVVDLFCAQVDDAELIRLRHESQVFAFELLVNNALGAFLDSGEPAHIERAVQCVDALEAIIQWKTHSTDYQLACVFARAGLTGRALDMVERAVDGGHAIETMARDSDLASVVDEPRFVRLRDSA